MSLQKLDRLLQQAIEHHRAGRLADAETLYRQAQSIAPGNFDVVHLSGALAYDRGRTNEAIELLTRALAIDPQSAICRMRLGLALIDAGRLPEAERRLREAVHLKPDFLEAWDNLAYVLKIQDRLKAAVECHERVIRLKPGFGAGWYNYGHTLSLMGQNKLALRCQEKALAADPGFALARFGLAQSLRQNNRLAEAISEYDRFLAQKPRHHPARSCRLFALQYLDGIPREQLFADHVAYGRVVGTPRAPVLPNTAEPDRRLRLAILSPDLRAHSCAFFLEPLLQHLDRTSFELLLYLDHIRDDATSARLRSFSAVWRNFIGQPDLAVERTIRSDQPDILIDLAGHSGMAARLPLFARRLAPVQITYLGYPDTTGLPAMDYRFTDAIADPEGEADRFATERLVRFAPTAWAYLPPEYAPEPSPSPLMSGMSPTFGSFSSLTKVNDTTIALWSQVLQAVPGSQLLLKGADFDDPEVCATYRARFQAAGAPIDRIELVPRTAEGEDHLGLYRRVDVALDTFPYHGTTTTCEALWMGVPVITRRGDRHAARVGASLLTAVGHPEWIAADNEEYVRAAFDLISDPQRLAALRTTLRAEMKRSPLLDHAGQAARFATALRSCWIDWCKRSRPPGGSRQDTS